MPSREEKWNQEKANNKRPWLLADTLVAVPESFHTISDPHVRTVPTYESVMRVHHCSQDSLGLGCVVSSYADY